MKSVKSVTVTRELNQILNKTIPTIFMKQTMPNYKEEAHSCFDHNVQSVDGWISKTRFLASKFEQQ